MIRLVLFGTSGCHLCEQAEQLIREFLRDDFELFIETIDIAEFEQWQEKYALRIPVLYHPETQNELGWPFDQTNIEEFIKRLTNG
ncbi:MAG: glutaredoxin family protein [Methylobacter sp.]|nr:glutaredoxin family protein [Methylobacter sp.]